VPGTNLYAAQPHHKNCTLTHWGAGFFSDVDFRCHIPAPKSQKSLGGAHAGPWVCLPGFPGTIYIFKIVILSKIDRYFNILIKINIYYSLHYFIPKRSERKRS